MIKLIAALSVVLLVSCGNPPKRLASAHVEQVSLTTSACYGMCPAYEISVYRDGTLRFVGKSDTKVQGNARGILPAVEVEKLFRAFAESEFLAFANRYTKEDVSDGVTSVLVLEYSGTQKEVRAYSGDSTVPQAFYDLKDLLRRVAEGQGWVE